MVCGFYLVGQPLLAGTVFKKFRQSLGWWRFHLMAFLLLTMVGLIVKMILRWTVDLKYIVYIPEYFFNI